MNFNQENVNSAIDLLEQYKKKAAENAFLSLYKKGEIKGEYSFETVSKSLQEKKLSLFVTEITKEYTYFELSWPCQLEELFVETDILIKEIF